MTAAVSADRTIDLSDYDPDHNDRQKIEAGAAVPCRLCVNAFRRVRLTYRYCQCGVGFCEGEHGNFLQAGPRSLGRCVQCGPHAKHGPR